PEAELEAGLVRVAGDGGDEIRRKVMHQGTDALGWYVPFHYTGIQWGIYLPVSGIVSLASTCFSSLKISASEKLLISMRAIHQHELLHFAVNYAVGQLEC